MMFVCKVHATHRQIYTFLKDYEIFALILNH